MNLKLMALCLLNWGKFMSARLVQAFPALHNCKLIFVLNSLSLDPTVIQLNAIKISTLTSVTYQLYLQLDLQALQSCVLIKILCLSLMLWDYETERFMCPKYQLSMLNWPCVCSLYIYPLKDKISRQRVGHLKQLVLFVEFLIVLSFFSNIT